MGLNNFTTRTGAAEFTDVTLDSVSLPSGYEIGEDAGDLVIRDTNGTIVLRRVDGGNWSFEGQTVDVSAITNLTTINADNLATVRDSANETGDYQIQKDGTDGTGVINFKTQ